MKATVYLRMAPTSRGFKYAATSKPSNTPLFVGNEALPTVAFALVLSLPPHMFSVPVVGEIEITHGDLTPMIVAELEEQPASPEIPF
jgi:hypothetical protein